MTQISVITQWLTTVEPLFDIRPQAFTPPPQVTSSLIRLQPKATRPDAATWDALEAVTAAAGHG